MPKIEVPAHHPPSTESGFPRRRFLAGISLLGLSAGAVVIATPKKKSGSGEIANQLNPAQGNIAKPAQAPSQVKRRLQTKPRPHQRTATRLGRPLLHGEEEYHAFLASLNLRHITPGEVITPHINKCKGISNQLPPPELWGRMATTLHVADEIRSRLGVKLRYITSAYRCPSYNRACAGSASRSQHMYNRALDLVYDCSPRTAMNEARKLRNEGVFKGGLGLYSSFIHLDTRGQNATW